MVQSQWLGSQRRGEATDPDDSRLEQNLGSRLERQEGFEAATCLEPTRGVAQRAPMLKHPLGSRRNGHREHSAFLVPAAESVRGPQLLSAPRKRLNPQRRARVRNEPGPWSGGFAQGPSSVGSFLRGSDSYLEIPLLEPAPDGPRPPSPTTRHRSRTESGLRETTRVLRGGRAGGR